MEVLGILAALIAIVQFFSGNKSWTITKKIVTFVILGAASFLIFSVSGSNPPIVSAAADNTEVIKNTTTLEAYSATQPIYKADVTATPPTSSSQNQQEPADSPIGNTQTYTIYRSEKYVDLKRGRHYPYICSPGINNCIGFTMKFSYTVSGGNYVKNVWLVCVRENGDNWVEVETITINEGEEKEFTLRFDRAYNFTEIAIQHPIDYNNYTLQDSLSIYNIVYE